MRQFTRFAVAVTAAALISLPATAQQDPGFFVPGQQRGQPQQRQGQPAQRPAQQPAQQRPAQAPQTQVQAPQPGAGPEQQQIPELPALPRGEAPPAAVIGVIGVPDIMRISSAAQQVEREIGQRRQKLNDEAAREQQAWRDAQQQLANQRASLSADQLRNRERELQERITNAQRVFRERNQAIQEAAQFSLAQIERMLIAVIRQVADSRGMNLVLHRAQVALNVNEFDISEQVAVELNKILPAVSIPPEVPAAPAAASAPAQQQPAQPQPQQQRQQQRPQR